jgi:hypothetical protein
MTAVAQAGRCRRGVRFRNRKAALAGRDRLANKTRRQSFGRCVVLLGWYRCDECAGWHLTDRGTGQVAA